MMHKIKMSTEPNVFLSNFRKPSHPYLTAFYFVFHIKSTDKLSTVFANIEFL